MARTLLRRLMVDHQLVATVLQRQHNRLPMHTRPRRHTVRQHPSPRLRRTPLQRPVYRYPPRHPVLAFTPRQRPMALPHPMDPLRRHMVLPRTEVRAVIPTVSPSTGRSTLETSLWKWDRPRGLARATLVTSSEVHTTASDSAMIKPLERIVYTACP